MSECGWCFNDMVPLQVTHPESGEVVGRLCRKCGRIYLDDLIPSLGTIRLDPKRGTEDDQ